VSVDPVKSVFRRIVKSTLLGRVPSTVLSIERDFEPDPNVKVLSATLVMLNRAFTFSKAST